MARVLVMQHAQPETLGTIGRALGAADIAFECVRVFAGQPVPKVLDGVDGLIIMGGPMSVYEQESYSFLSDEIRLIERALSEEKSVLGVCLGSQLLAAALGAAVRKGRKKEIGWHQIALKEAAADDRLLREITSSFVAFHWHGDVFGLPSGAVSLAASALTEHQAFRYGRAYGFLFHMEVDEAVVRGMVEAFTSELRQEDIDGREIVEAAKQHLPGLQKIGSVVFRRWAETVITRQP